MNSIKKTTSTHSILYIIGFLLFLMIVYLIYYESTEKNKVGSKKDKKELSADSGKNKSEGSKKIAQLRTRGKESGFKDFKETLERQAKTYPDIFYLESLDFEKKVALTFDDGPDLQFTSQVLDILKENNIKATFFLVGFKMQRHPDIVKRIYDEGHALGNHSYSHPDFNMLSKEELLEKQIERCEEIFEDLAAIQPVMIRPPYGKIKDEQIQYLGDKGYKIIDWSIDTYDWDQNQNSKDEIVSRVTTYIHEGAIILLHSGGDNKENTVRALPEIINDLKEKGYTFVTVSDLLKIPAVF